MATSTGKKEQVEKMFDNIAHKYDFLNHFLSAGIDRIWRKKLVKMVAAQKPLAIIDIATGTADLAIELSKLTHAPVTGVDISAGMLEIGKRKLAKLKLDQQIFLQQADSESLPFENGAFDAAMVAFGVRNFENLDIGLAEIQRVLRPNGIIAVLEFSRPRVFPVKQLYNFYFRYILPAIGKIVSRDQGAYTYLPESVGAFPDGKDFLAHLDKAGFSKTSERRLTFGIATIYTAYSQS